MKISKYIQNAAKKIPVTWPLQQLIAVNPLEDLTEESIYDASIQMAKTTSAQLAMPAQFYIDLYDNGHLSHSSLEKAIENQLQHILKLKIDTQQMGMLKNKILSRMISAEGSRRLLEAEELLEYNQRKQTGLLVSSQIAKYFYDDPFTTTYQECCHWLSSYFAKSIKDMLPENQSMFAAWRKFTENKNKDWFDIINGNSDDVILFIENIAKELNISDVIMQAYITNILWQLKGWAGYIKWQENYSYNNLVKNKACMADIVAIWLANELYIVKKNQKKLDGIYVFDEKIKDVLSAEIPLVFELKDAFNVQGLNINPEALVMNYYDIIWIWQNAYELLYHDKLINKLRINLNTHIFNKKKNDAQLVFCIDVRSEGIRRHLEKQGNYATYGYAGFFGLAFKLDNKSNNKISYQCPALINPNLHLEMQSEVDHRYVSLREEIGKTFSKIKKGILSPFIFFESIGFLSFFRLIGKNYFPGYLSRADSFIKDKEKDYKLSFIEQVGIEQAKNFAKKLLVDLALKDNISSLVVLCGHGATTSNNPYQAGLDCGACGGNSGLSNAIIACDLLNNTEVRTALINDGFNIQDDCIFIAALHDTTTDVITWHYDPNIISADNFAKLAILKKDIVIACKKLTKERLSTLEGEKNLHRRAASWSELMPEWGLAGNAAMIVAPREISKKLNLERRVFLHSYEPSADEDGTILESILLAPVIVANWINMQYYFSTVDEINYGSGNKAIHNIVGGIGVMEGNISDLKFGLPIQSIRCRNRLMHSPIRLLLVIYAAQHQVDAIIQKHKILRNLINGEWIKLHVISPI